MVNVAPCCAMAPVVESKVAANKSKHERCTVISWYESPVIVIPHRHRTEFGAIKDGCCFLEERG